MGYIIDNQVNVVTGSYQLGDAPTGLNFVTDDVDLQFDVVGNQVQLTVWGASQPKPASPQLKGTVLSALVHTVTVSLWAFPPSSDWNKPAAFRYVEVVAIPEPSSLALGSLSAVTLASFAFRTRLLRVRSGRRRLGVVAHTNGLRF